MLALRVVHVFEGNIRLNLHFLHFRSFLDKGMERDKDNPFMIDRNTFVQPYTGIIDDLYSIGSIK